MINYWENCLRQHLTLQLIIKVTMEGFKLQSQLES